MFNYQTTLILNSLKDSSGKDVISKVETDRSLALNILRFGYFEKECILNLYHKAPEKAKNAKFVWKAPATLTKGSYKLIFNTRFVGECPSTQATGLGYHGKTFSFDFITTQDNETAENIVTILKDLIKKYNRLHVGTEEFSVSSTTDTITFEGKDPYMNFTNVRLEKLTTEPFSPAYSVVKVYSVRDGQGAPVEVDGSKVEPGSVGFGTFENLIRTEMLPTHYNYHFYSLNSDRQPIKGGMYHQYIIENFVNRGVMGTDSLAQDTNARTTHIIWVHDSIKATFDAKVKEVYPDVVEITDATDGTVATDPKVTGPTKKGEKTKKFQEES